MQLFIMQVKISHAGMAIREAGKGSLKQAVKKPSILKTHAHRYLTHTHGYLRVASHMETLSILCLLRNVSLQDLGVLYTAAL